MVRERERGDIQGQMGNYNFPVVANRRCFAYETCGKIWINEISSKDFKQGSFKYFPELVYFTKNCPLKSFRLYFLQSSYLWQLHYTLLPEFIKFLETFLKPILGTSFNCFTHSYVDHIICNLV